MFEYEYTARGPVNVERAWALLSDVNRWPEWEPVVASVEFEGPFVQGAQGVKQLRHGQPLPFVIRTAEENRCMALESQRGPMLLLTEYRIAPDGITQRLTITGGNEVQRGHMSGKIVEHIPENMEHLREMTLGQAHGPAMPQMATREEALQKFFAAWAPAGEIEEVPLDACVGRTLAITQKARYTLPAAHVAGCDGIGVRSADFAAGIPDTSGWKLGEEYVMVDTGDDFPDAYDAVIQIEQVRFSEDGVIRLLRAQPVKAGESVRPRGSAIREGDLLLEAGRVIRPTDIGALAMGGCATVPVYKRPVVAFMPTGTELIAPGAEPKRGENIDSNSPMVVAMLREMGADAYALPVTRDSVEGIEAVFDEAIARADMVVLNGGSSKGGEDFCTKMLRRRGEIIQYQIAAVPGRPMALAIVDGKPVVNLPGPPLAAYFGADWCLRALMDRWMNREPAPRHWVQAKLREAQHPGGPVEILNRMEAVRNETGEYEVLPLDMRRTSSARILTTNAQYVSPLGDAAHPAGEMLTVELI